MMATSRIWSELSIVRRRRRTLQDYFLKVLNS